MLTADDGEAQQQHGRDPDRDGADEAAGNAEGALEFGLPDAEGNQRGELEAEAAALEKDVECDQPLETQQ